MPAKNIYLRLNVVDHMVKKLLKALDRTLINRILNCIVNNLVRTCSRELPTIFVPARSPLTAPEGILIAETHLTHTQQLLPNSLSCPPSLLPQMLLHPTQRGPRIPPDRARLAVTDTAARMAGISISAVLNNRAARFI